MEGSSKRWSNEKNRLHTNPFIPRTPSRLVAPIDLVLSVLIFCLPFLRFSSHVAHWVARMLIEFQMHDTTQEFILFYIFANCIKNSFVAILFLFVDSPSFFFFFFSPSKWRTEINQHPCIAGQRENDTPHHHHHHVLTVGVVTWALIDNVTSGASHLTCLRGGRERYYEATSTKPLHWQAS